MCPKTECWTNKSIRMYFVHEISFNPTDILRSIRLAFATLMSSFETQVHAFYHNNFNSNWNSIHCYHRFLGARWRMIFVKISRGKFWITEFFRLHPSFRFSWSNWLLMWWGKKWTCGSAMLAVFCTLNCLSCYILHCTYCEYYIL